LVAVLLACGAGCLEAPSLALRLPWLRPRSPSDLPAPWFRGTGSLTSRPLKSLAAPMLLLRTSSPQPRARLPAPVGPHEKSRGPDSDGGQHRKPYRYKLVSGHLRRPRTRCPTKCMNIAIRMQTQPKVNDQGNNTLGPAFLLVRGRHPPFTTAPVADSQRSLTRCSE
jgi:hypothetical protein